MTTGLPPKVVLALQGRVASSVGVAGSTVVPALDVRAAGFRFFVFYVRADLRRHVVLHVHLHRSAAKREDLRADGRHIIYYEKV